TLAAFLTATLPAQTVSVGQDMSIAFHGFISATAFAQDQEFTFCNGQNAEFPNPPEATVARWFGGADVRNTRIGLFFTGPKISTEWRANAVAGRGFFGGNNRTDAVPAQQ